MAARFAAIFFVICTSAMPAFARPPASFAKIPSLPGISLAALDVAPPQSDCPPKAMIPESPPPALPGRADFLSANARAFDREMSNLLEAPGTARADFLALLADTYDELTGIDDVIIRNYTVTGNCRQQFDTLGQRNWLSIITPDAHSAGNLLNDVRAMEAMSEPLRKRWLAWKTLYDGLRSRNPRLELHDMISRIGESHSSSSWPSGYEQKLQDWVDADDRDAMPFDDRDRIVTPHFYARLRDLRTEIGGWLALDEEAVRVVYMPEADWQALRARKKAEDEEARRLGAEASEREKRNQIRLYEIQAIARKDKAFWARLTEWELDQEAKDPSDTIDPLAKLSAIARRSGPLSFRRPAPETGKPQGNGRRSRTLPPLFADFIATLERPGDDVSDIDIVSHLRMSIRRDIGLPLRFRMPVQRE